MILMCHGENQPFQSMNDQDYTTGPDCPEKLANYWISRSKHSKTLLPESFTPTDYSVVLGRTKFCFESIGNRRFKVTVNMFLQEYSEARSKAEKSRIVSRVYDLIRNASPEGAFVSFENGRWWECSERISREKIGAMFRDLLPHSYQSSSKAKQAKKKSMGRGILRNPCDNGAASVIPGIPEATCAGMLPVDAVTSVFANKAGTSIDADLIETKRIERLTIQHAPTVCQRRVSVSTGDSELPFPAFASAGPTHFPKFFDVDSSNFVPLERAESQQVTKEPQGGHKLDKMPWSFQKQTRHSHGTDFYPV